MILKQIRIYKLSKMEQTINKVLTNIVLIQRQIIVFYSILLVPCILGVVFVCFKSETATGLISVDNNWTCDFQLVDIDFKRDLHTIIWFTHMFLIGFRIGTFSSVRLVHHTWWIENLTKKQKFGDVWQIKILKGCTVSRNISIIFSKFD